MLHFTKYLALMGYIKQSALPQLMSPRWPPAVLHPNTTPFIKASITPVNCRLCIRKHIMSPKDRALKPLPSFRHFSSSLYGWIHHSCDRRMAVQPALLKFLTILSTSRMLASSLSEVPHPRLFSSGSFWATGDNAIEYKALKTDSAPCQHRCQVRGCEKVK